MEFKDLRNNLITQKYTQIKKEEDYTFNAPHTFIIERVKDGEELCTIHFQEGPIKEFGVNGVCNEDLIAMVIERLECFQNSDFKCVENAMAIHHLKESLVWLRERTKKREAKGIEGTHIV